MKLFRIAMAFATIGALAGCGTKANTFDANGRGYASGLPAHAGQVCMMTGTLPAGIPHEVVGILRGNKQVPGGFEVVRSAMADEARKKGADVVENLVMRQDVAFRGIFILRPVGEGTALRLADPGSLDCAAAGGMLFGNGQRMPAQGVPKATALTAAPPAATNYDDCMKRVLRISDSDLRMQAMKACDPAP